MFSTIKSKLILAILLIVGTFIATTYLTMDIGKLGVGSLKKNGDFRAHKSSHQCGNDGAKRVSTIFR